VKCNKRKFYKTNNNPSRNPPKQNQLLRHRKLLLHLATTSSPLTIPQAFVLKTRLSASPTYCSNSPAQDKSYTRYHLAGSSAPHTTTKSAIESSHPVCLSSNNIPAVSKPQMQPCLNMRASIRGSAIPMFQKRHMPAHPHQPCRNAQTASLILNLTHPRLVTHISLLYTHLLRALNFSQPNSASDYCCPETGHYHIAPSPENYCARL